MSLGERHDEREDLVRVARARLTVLAEQVLESPAAAHAWLISPHPLLGGLTPLEAAATEEGAARVERILDNLEHGLPL